MFVIDGAAILPVYLDELPAAKKDEIYAQIGLAAESAPDVLVDVEERRTVERFEARVAVRPAQPGGALPAGLSATPVLLQREAITRIGGGWNAGRVLRDSSVALELGAAVPLDEAGGAVVGFDVAETLREEELGIAVLIETSAPARTLESRTVFARPKARCQRCENTVDARDIHRCSHRCSFCSECTAELSGVCPNCSGRLEASSGR